MATPNQVCLWCNQPLFTSTELPICTKHNICQKCKLNRRTCQSACPCCWYDNGTELISKYNVCSVCRNVLKSNTEFGKCYHQHKHCLRCSSSACSLCKFLELRSWINCTFENLPQDFQPILETCHFLQKKYEELQQTNITPLKRDASFMDIDSSSNSAVASLQNSTNNNCPICLEDLGMQSVRLPACQHQFHNECVSKWFQTSGKQSCPTCGYVYGILKGPQPPHGQMVVNFISTPLPGYPIGQYAPNEGPTFQITYTIPSGIQGELNPNPGHPYKGTVRSAYLPNTPEGLYVLQLLKRAFDDQHVFTIGRSTTTGEDNVVTWNDIHHKTNIHGGPENFGYPDPTYLIRVCRELADKGYR